MTRAFHAHQHTFTNDWGTEMKVHVIQKVMETVVFLSSWRIQMVVIKGYVKRIVSNKGSTQITEQMLLCLSLD